VRLLEVVQVRQPDQHVEVEEHEAQVERAGSSIEAPQHHPADRGVEQVDRDQLAELCPVDGTARAQVLQQRDQAQYREADRPDDGDLDRVDAARALAASAREQRRIEREAQLRVARRCGQVQIKP